MIDPKGLPLETDTDCEGAAAPESSAAETMDFVFDMLAQLSEMSEQCGEANVALLLKLIIESRDRPESTIIQ